jgi:hypothetical protein
VDRLTDEAEYVLAVLYRMREEVIANPQLFEPMLRSELIKPSLLLNR